jgi:hypothetical protein
MTNLIELWMLAEVVSDMQIEEKLALLLLFLKGLLLLPSFHYHPRIRIQREKYLQGKNS